MYGGVGAYETEDNFAEWPRVSVANSAIHRELECGTGQLWRIETGGSSQASTTSRVADVVKEGVRRIKGRRTSSQALRSAVGIAGEGDPESGVPPEKDKLAVSRNQSEDRFRGR